MKFLTYSSHQIKLFPPSVHGVLGADHLCDKLATLRGVQDGYCPERAKGLAIDDISHLQRNYVCRRVRDPSRQAYPVFSDLAGQPHLRPVNRVERTAYTPRRLPAIPQAAGWMQRLREPTWLFVKKELLRVPRRHALMGEGPTKTPPRMARCPLVVESDTNREELGWTAIWFMLLFGFFSAATEYLPGWRQAAEGQVRASVRLSVRGKSS